MEAGDWAGSISSDSTGSENNAWDEAEGGLWLRRGWSAGLLGGRVASIVGQSDGIGGERLVAALDQDQAAKAIYAFDAPEQLDWHFIPRPRKGLPFKEMNPAPRPLAFGLVRVNGGERIFQGHDDHEPGAGPQGVGAGKGPVRDPELYFVTIFGTPSDRGHWGWRVEGHHLSLNFTLENGKVVAATPAFFGSNPAEVRDGPRRGMHTLADVEDRALRLVQALDSDRQSKEADRRRRPRPRTSAPPNTLQPPTDIGQGIAFADLNDEQREMLQALVEAYASRHARGGRQPGSKRSSTPVPTTVRFAWFGSADRLQPHAYRVQGPTFLIEFNNTQNGANHIHSVWRNMLGDFGIPLKKS